MNIIKILSPSEAQKIAAGECVERPANIVKEIIENSIDAGATNITLYIEQAGKKLIRIVDNGSGLTEQDAQMCFLPHATSKINSINDLENISSFGFRGEALASISAVSKVCLTTLSQEHENNVGVKIEYSQAELISQMPASCPRGTDLKISDLFYNMPARKKFLKQDETEWNQILIIFQAFCLSHLHISFKLFHDNNMIINAPPVKDVNTRVSQLWDTDIARNLISIATTTMPDWLKLSGYISQPNFWRYNRNWIFLFVNGRWVKNQELSKAIIKGYLNVLPPARFPAAFIFIECESTLVDVNVHPKKEEVRFVKSGTVENAILNSVKITLENFVNEKILGSVQSQNQTSKADTDNFFDNKFKNLNFDSNFGINFSREQMNSTSQGWRSHPFDYAQGERPKTDYTELNESESKCHHEQPIEKCVRPECSEYNEPFDKAQDRLHRTGTNTAPPQIQKNIEPQPQSSHKIIGQLFNTYILLEQENEFVIIDQHAAHERILYEKYLKNFEQKDGISLLFPETMELSQTFIAHITKHLDFFASQGIALEPIGPTTLAIRSTPIKLQKQSLKEVITQAAEFISENDKLDHEEFRQLLNEHVHSHMACKAAIKAGDKLTLEEMEKLISDLSQTEKRFICVHGRPTIWTIKKDMIEKQFQRKL